MAKTPFLGASVGKFLEYWQKKAAVAPAGEKMALSGAYTGARSDRAQLSRYLPTGGSANADTIADLPMLRKRSRDQMRNAPVAVGALNIKVSNEIGTGLSYSPAIDAEFLGLSQEDAQAWGDNAKRRFTTWASSPDCDVARRLDFYGLQELARRSQLESGDVFVVTPRLTRNGRKRLALQLIEADRVCNPDRKPNNDRLIEGIEIDPLTTEAIACFIAQKHPGDFNAGANTWDRRLFRGPSTGRRNVLQIFKPLRPDQVRGVPMIAPIIEPLKQLARWSDAELNAAVVSGLMATFVKMDPEAFQDIYDEDAKEGYVDNASKWSGEIESGKAINLLPGESIESPPPGRPNPAFDPFWQAMVRQIGMALEMPYEVLVMHFQSSYSASRAALLMAWKAFRSGRELVVKNLCQPVFELWLADEVAEGRISAPGFFADEVVRAAWCAAAWVGDGPGSIDPVKDVTAAEKRVALGISTKQDESVAYDGRDWQPKHEQRVREIQAEKDAGIYVVPAGSSLAADAQADEAEQTRQDDQRRAVQQEREALASQLRQLNARMDVLAAREASITVNTPPVTVNQGDTHVTPPSITVEGHEINVTMPEGMVQLDAHIDTPAVTVNTPPAQVVVQSAHRVGVEQVHSYDEEGNLVKTITTDLTA
jgi:lambda family phage portal protein